MIIISPDLNELVHVLACALHGCIHGGCIHDGFIHGCIMIVVFMVVSMVVVSMVVSDSDSLFTKFYNKENVSKAVSIQT